MTAQEEHNDDCRMCIHERELERVAAGEHCTVCDKPLTARITFRDGVCVGKSNQGAHEIATAAIEAERRVRYNRSSARIAGAALEALHRAGFDFVALPAPPKRDICVSCGTVLSPVFDTASTTNQYADALEVKLSGGFGMFFDNFDGDHHVFLCGSCATASCAQLAWLAKLLRPAGGGGVSG